MNGCTGSSIIFEESSGFGVFFFFLIPSAASVILQMIYLSVDKQATTMVLSTRMPDLGEKGFLFSTKDFVDCLRPYSEHNLHSNVETSNHTDGQLLFVGRDCIRKGRKGQCRIRVTVPHDKVILFELLDLALPCTTASLRIYASAQAKSRAMVANVCGNYRKANQDNRIVVPVHTVLVILSLQRIVFTNLLHLKFSAVSQSYLHQLQHITINEHKGFFFAFVLELACSFVLTYAISQVYLHRPTSITLQLFILL